jgi:hypothetical protein
MGTKSGGAEGARPFETIIHIIELKAELKYIRIPWRKYYKENITGFRFRGVLKFRIRYLLAASF